jgi:hypothetical protein
MLVLPSQSSSRLCTDVGERPSQKNLHVPFLPPLIPTSLLFLQLILMFQASGQCCYSRRPLRLMKGKKKLNSSSGIELQLYCFSVKESSELGAPPIPIFGDGDEIGGKVMLDSAISQPGQLHVSVSQSVPERHLLQLIDCLRFKGFFCMTRRSWMTLCRPRPSH